MVASKIEKKTDFKKINILTLRAARIFNFVANQIN